ncbi:TGS-like [Sesbania bispinosa]|nr:TGS-like [Sesbania bispinosa]
MATVMQKIKDIEDEMARTQKNKATAHHLGLLKAKLAKLRRELLTPTSKGAGGAGEGFDVTKSGDSRVGLVGFPSVGKSTLLNKLTGTFSEVASYEFTTLTCIPGVITYRGAKIQLLDLPGIIEGAKDGKGRGRQPPAHVAGGPGSSGRGIQLKERIWLNKEPPNLTFRKKDKGGINLTSTVTTTHLDLETVKAICSEYRIHNADITLRYDATADDLIDVIEGSRVYMPCIYVVNKIDQITLEELEILDKLPHYCPISAHLEWNLDGLLDKIWEYLDLTRIYTKPKGMNPDYEDPVILSSKKRTVEDFCNRIHKDMVKQFKYALVWGSSAKHKPQRVGKEHELEDEDVVQIIKKNLRSLHEIFSRVVSSHSNYLLFIQLENMGGKIEGVLVNIYTVCWWISWLWNATVDAWSWRCVEHNVVVISIEQGNAMNLEDRDVRSALSLEHMPSGSAQTDTGNVNANIGSDDVPNVYSDFLTENVELRHDMDDE